MPSRISQNSDTDEENDETIDPELRLRTVRTAHSAIMESIRSEQRAEKRKTMHKKRSRFFRFKKQQPSQQERPSTAASADVNTTTNTVPGQRRNVYVNWPLSAMEVDHDGEPVARYVRNKVKTSSAYILFSWQGTRAYDTYVQNILFSPSFPKTCTNNFGGQSR